MKKLNQQKKVYITYFVHGTTTDNEIDKATGWNPGELSALGIKQSIDLLGQIKGKVFDSVFSSDLKRAIDSAKLTWGSDLKLVTDWRLRECNYGDLNCADGTKKDAIMPTCIEKKFPNGESYVDVEMRMHEFLHDLVSTKNEKHIAIVAHQAPQLALDVIIHKKTWKEAMEQDWRHHKAWKPGWEYVYEEQTA